MRHLQWIALSLALANPAGLSGQATDAIRVMLLDGESAGPYHRWELVTRVLTRQLEETGLFDVDIVTAPTPGTDRGDFRPNFSQYAAVVFNYDAPDQRWPDSLKQSFEEYVSNGGGVVIVHASDNAFPGWDAFNRMTGIGGWRGRTETAGPLWYYENGHLVSDPSPGRAGSHGRRIPFRIERREPHPITEGLPPVWMHQGDELYAELRGPGENMTVLATAYSDPANNGTGRDEPMLLAVGYGDGRIFHTTLGHDIQALSSVDFVVTFQRGTEWAATGRVTQEVPASFPTANVVGYRADLAAMDPRYGNGLDPLDRAAQDARAITAPWRPLFNGEDLDGWQHVGPGEILVENGLLKTVGGMGLLWYSREMFGDAVIRVVYRNPGGANSGVFIRIPERPMEPWMPINRGYEVQIDDTDDEYHVTGVLYSLTEARARPARPDEWNTMEITLDGDRTRVDVNGVLVTDYVEGDPVPPKVESWEPDRGLRPSTGFIGLQNHADVDTVYFREISVRPLTTD